jgi:NADH:ubiquinone oxidoreductase subunit 2 (subunit N)
MNYLPLSIGSITILIGLAIIVLTIVFLRENRVKNILTGIVFAVLGASIIWLSLQKGDTPQINIGVSDKQFGFFLVGFVMSLFILRGILSIRESSQNLQDKTISSFGVFKSKFLIIVGAILIIWSVLILLVAFSQFGR